jgi:pilus assembly protein CpaE
MDTLSSKGALGSEPSLVAMVFVRDRDAEGVVRLSLSDLGVQEAMFGNGGIAAAVTELAQRTSPRLLVVDIAGLDDPEKQVRELVEVTDAGTGIIAIGDRNDIVLYRNLRQIGVAEYFFMPLVRSLVTKAFNSVLTGTHNERASRTGKLVHVLGVRGGVGATTIAVRAAWHLAESRQRPVAFVDLDLYGGDAALQMNAVPNNALHEALEHSERVDDLFLERGIIHVSKRLDMLASLEPLDSPLEFAEDAFLSLLETLLYRYRYVFVDMPTLSAQAMMRVMHMPSTLLLVSDGRLVSARDVARWRDKIGPNTPERSSLHILNKNGADGSLSLSDFARAAGGEPDVVIPFVRDVSAASNLAVQGLPELPAFKRGLSNVLRQISGEAADVQPSLLARLFA